MEDFRVTTDLNLADWRALQRAAQLRAATNAGLARRVVMRLPLALLAIAIFAGVTLLPRMDQKLPWVVAILMTIVSFAILGRLTLRQYLPVPGGLFLGPLRLTFAPAGIGIWRRGSESRLHWSQVLGVEASGEHVFLWCDSVTAYCIPARDLPAPLDALAAVERIRGFMASADALPQAASDAAPEGSPTPHPAADNERPIVSPARELLAVLRLLGLRPVDGASIVGRDISITLLAAVMMALWIPLDPLLYTEPLQFMPYAISGLAWIALGSIALAWLLSRLCRLRIEYRRSLLLVLGALPMAMLGSALAAILPPDWIYIVIGGVAAWALLYFQLGLRAVTGAIQGRALVVGAAAAFAFVLLTDLLYINPSVWVFSEDSEESADSESYVAAWQRMGEVQFVQQARIDAQVDGIVTQRAPGPQIYFLGFAGYGEQRVFAGEIALAASSVGTRYGTGERSLQLVNDRRDLDKLPLATMPALRHALKSLGKAMDDDDVLFLALSSHGSEDATLSVSNTGMMATSLAAQPLADMLRESGIRWKVIVISACHSGSFIDALKDDHSIILTAAAKERASFGCSDDRDLTYFGEAFYRDALPKEASLRAAFDAARTAIEKREKQEGIDASLPQAHFGIEMERKLAEMDVAKPRD